MMYTNSFRISCRVSKGVKGFVFLLLVCFAAQTTHSQTPKVRICNTCSESTHAGFSYADTLRNSNGDIQGFMASIVGWPFYPVVQRGNIRLTSTYLFGCVVPTLVLPNIVNGRDSV